MATKLVNDINKEFYKMQIESLANNLIKRADDILNDWDKGIMEININSTINGQEIPTLNIEKKYLPIKEVK